MKLCNNPDCRCLWGLFAPLVSNVIPFNGWFYLYEGSYWRALWRWLTRPDPPDDDDDDDGDELEAFA